MSNGPDQHGEGRVPSSWPEAVAGVVSLIGGAIGAVQIVVVLVITTAGVFFRYVIDRPLLGIDEATGFLVVSIVMFGAAEALRRDDHIRIDILIERAGPRARRALDAWACLAVLGFAGLLFWTAWNTVTFSRAFGAYSDGYLQMPLWIPQSTMLVGAALLGLQAVARLLRGLGGR